MNQRFVHDLTCRRAAAVWSGVWFGKRLAILLLVALGALPGRGQNGSAAGTSSLASPLPRYFLTNAVQFRNFPVGEYMDECVVRVPGVVTLIDTNRDLLVLQDATGALAVHLDRHGTPLQAGQLVSLTGTNCYPYIVSFPDYPYRPAGRELLSTFEGPTDWGEYNLTRMRGWLRPPVTGEYTFWIASDNSSELWLSSDGDPANAKRIAFLARYSWVSPRDWGRFPSQRSDPVMLKAGTSYYLEALQEQTTLSENVAVAWQGPDLKQAVIDGRYLTPWPDSGGPRVQTNGILREYWTNYSSGDLTVLNNSAELFASAVSVAAGRVEVLGPGKLPEAKKISPGQPLAPGDNFRWVKVAGRLTFAGVSGDTAYLELSDGDERIQVRAFQWDRDFLSRYREATVCVEGVCEGVNDQSGNLVPGLIWAPAESCFSLIENTTTNLIGAATTAGLLNSALANTNPVMNGFYYTRGVVLFNDRVLGKDYLFVQEDTASAQVSLRGKQFKNQLQVGEWIELGGTLQRGRYVPVIDPLIVTEMGWRSMPAPITLHGSAGPENTEGRWTEVEGVCQAVNGNGTISLMERTGPVLLWVGQTASNQLSEYVDARVRARGALSLSALDRPLLLVPSPHFMEVEEAPPEDPFSIPACPIAQFLNGAAQEPGRHRAKLRGEVVYRDDRSFVIQDRSGGIRVNNRGNRALALGETVEVAGFPAASGPIYIVTDALVQPTKIIEHLKPDELNLADLLAFKQSETLVQVTANLISSQSQPAGQVLELQEQQHLFAAVLSTSAGSLPPIPAGSRIQVTGVCDDGSFDLPAAAQPVTGKPAVGSLRILLRGPADVVVLSGPPWWTLKKTGALVGTLLTILLVTLLWVYLLRRRLERQQAARVTFSRQILQGQESERQRIAVNLHDSLGQNLLVIMSQARRALQLTDNEAERQNRLNKISEITSQAIEEVRQITRDLRPYQLDRLGLTQAIRAIVNQASENSSILFATYLDTIDGVFDKESEIHVYRIVQEALNNILKHSAATEATVVIKNQAAIVSLSIRDNGRGFDPHAVESTSAHDVGYGLSGMRERTRILGGKFMVDSHPEQGTNFTIEITKPLAKA